MSSQINLDACRFCDNFSDSDDRHIIDDSLKSLYLNLTGTELVEDDNLPRISCSGCYSEIKDASKVKTKVMEGQDRLLKKLEEEKANQLAEVEEIEERDFEVDDHADYEQVDEINESQIKR